ncbi:hypothetical protein ABE042_15645 [Viridibacillus arvi]|uniref:hypothetical protein n=1 Tax=Viridibacillus arvi TaxID=263475 RepID=UPI003D2A59EF
MDFNTWEFIQFYFEKENFEGRSFKENAISILLFPFLVICCLIADGLKAFKR